MRRVALGDASAPGVPRTKLPTAGPSSCHLQFDPPPPKDPRSSIDPDPAYMHPDTAGRARACGPLFSEPPM